MKEQDKAYLAGIIDGEGSIMLIKFHKNEYPSPCVSIASTSIELLDWINQKTMVGRIKSKKNYKPNMHQNSFTYEVKYNDAIKFLTYIEPYLIIPQKKLRAKMIIQQYKSVTPRNGRYNKELLKHKNDFYENFMAL
jgi:hypothetical protein